LGAKRLKAENEKISATEEQNESQLRKLGRIQFVLVALLFIAALTITEGIAYLLGDTAGTAALILIAAGTAAVLYRKEIKLFFRKKDKGENENE